MLNLNSSLDKLHLRTGGLGVGVSETETKDFLDPLPPQHDFSLEFYHLIFSFWLRPVNYVLDLILTDKVFVKMNINGLNHV